MMRKIISIILVGGCSLSNAYDDPWEREGYIAGSLNYFLMASEAQYGGSILPKNNLGATMLAGFKINSLIGIELGYVYLQSSNKKDNFKQNEMVIGRVVPSYQETHSAKYNLKSFEFNLNLFSDYFHEDAQFFASIGLANLKPKVTHSHVSTIAVVGLPEIFINTSETLTTKTKLIPKLGAGIHYMFNENFGLRGDVNWYNTSKFNNISAGVSGNTAKFKDTIKFGFGIVMFF